MNESKNNVCEEKTFESVFNHHAKTLRNFIYFKCGNSDQADDLVQDAFVKLWNNCAKVPFEKAKSYLYTIANNAFLNEVAHEKVKLKYRQHSSAAVNNENPDFVLREKEFKKELTQAIANLSEKQREVFLLNRIEKKKYKEIAEMLDISVKAVEKRMHGALVSLRKEIKYFK
ncbi:MAG: RNA polymerase sigma-70 factor [Flavobacteriaceae bacterium]|nr:RNA polymerase sigma-70 factor [Flavobacteriaceae bacterium]